MEIFTKIFFLSCFFQFFSEITLSGQQLYRINKPTDDAHQVSYLSITSSSLIIGRVGLNNVPSKTISGIRFEGIQLEQGMVIDSAFVQFSCDGPNLLIHLVTIFGEANSFAETFDNNSWSISSRDKTSVQVDWQMQGSCDDQDRNALLRTPNVSPIIEEIINRSDWLSGNPLAFILEPGIDSIDIQTTFYSYDNGLEDHIPELIIHASTVNTSNIVDKELQIQLAPNPSRASQLLIHLDQASHLRWAIFDVSGKFISQADQFFTKGEHTIPVQLAASSGTGLYFIKVFADEKAPVVLKWIRI